MPRVARILLTYVVPFLMPMAVYAAWSWYRARYAATHGGEAPQLERGPWPLLVFLGASRMRSTHVKRPFEDKRNFSTRAGFGGSYYGDDDGGGFRSGK